MSDVFDCQWIQQLHTLGLLRGSFRPNAEITAIRTLVRHRDKLVEEASEEEIAASLTGHYRDEHRFALRQELELYDFYQEKIHRCDEQSEIRIHALEAPCEPSARELPAPRRPSTPPKSPSPNRPAEPGRTQLPILSS